MSDIFEQAFKDVVEETQCLLELSETDARLIFNAGKKAAVEHCKQGGQEGFKSWLEETFSPDSDVLKVFSNHKPFLYLRMRNGEPDWSDDCVSQSHGDLLENGLMEDGEYSVLPLFAHAMPKSEESAITKLRDLYLRTLCTSETIYELTTVPIDELRKILDGAEATPQPSSDVSELVPEGYVLLPIEPAHADIRAMSESVAVDDEGQFPPMCDLLDFSGENKTHTVLRAAYKALIAKHTVK